MILAYVYQLLGTLGQFLYFAQIGYGSILVCWLQHGLQGIATTGLSTSFLKGKPTPFPDLDPGML